MWRYKCKEVIRVKCTECPQATKVHLFMDGEEGPGEQAPGLRVSLRPRKNERFSKGTVLVETLPCCSTRGDTVNTNKVSCLCKEAWTVTSCLAAAAKELQIFLTLVRTSDHLSIMRIIMIGNWSWIYILRKEMMKLSSCHTWTIMFTTWMWLSEQQEAEKELQRTSQDVSSVWTNRSAHPQIAGNYFCGFIMQ